MTFVHDLPDSAIRLGESVELVRRDLASGGYGLPAAGLQARTVADWVRAHGITVTARDDHDLDMLQHHGIRPNQVVFRCGPSTELIRRAVGLGIYRFIVCSECQVARLSECSSRTKYIYLGERSPLVFCNYRLKVIGLHSDVDASGGDGEWASAVDRLLNRAEVLEKCGSSIQRLMLSGGSNDMWLGGDVSRVAAIIAAVDEQLQVSCQRRRLRRPAVTLATAEG